MLHTTIAIRYARAMFHLTKALNVSTVVGSELLEFCAVMNKEKILKRVLFHPGISATEKIQVIEALLQNNSNPMTTRFITYIIGKKRIFFLESIAKSFESLLAEDQKRITIKVESFDVLSPVLEGRIKTAVSAMVKKDISIVSIVNPSLLGGLKLTLGDKVIDGTVLQHLRNLTKTVTAV